MAPSLLGTLQEQKYPSLIENRPGKDGSSLQGIVQKQMALSILCTVQEQITHFLLVQYRHR
jgi:hypothetical protein